MSDPINKLAEFLRCPAWLKPIVDHNLPLIVGAVAIAAVLFLPGCQYLQPRVLSPVSGKMVTGLQLEAEAVAWVAKWRAEGEGMAAQLEGSRAAIDQQIGVMEQGLSLLNGLGATNPAIAAVLGIATAAAGVQIGKQKASIAQLRQRGENHA
jgi:hypothetical protein